jgi:hypothetical protein
MAEPFSGVPMANSGATSRETQDYNPAWRLSKAKLTTDIVP